MKWFTIWVSEPSRDNPMPAIKNSAGQLIAFDGQAKKTEAMHLAQIYSDSYSHVALFAGKNLGKQIAVWKAGAIVGTAKMGVL